MYILLREGISLGRYPKQSTFGIAIISAGHKAKAPGHIVLTLFSFGPYLLGCSA